MARYKGYFDESGDFDSGEGILCISGYLLTSEHAAIMDAKWGETLAKYGVEYFHMVDVAHNDGIFKNVSLDDRIQLVKDLIVLIKQHTISGFSAAVRSSLFDAPQGRDPYSFCAGVIMCSLQGWEENIRPRGDIAYYFETGHKHRGNAYRDLAEALRETRCSVTFATKTNLRLLQAADLLAWQTTKHIKDLQGHKRPPRKDFLSLMEHPHTLLLMDTVSLPKTHVMHQIDWPESRRDYPYKAIIANEESMTVIGNFRPKYRWLPAWTVRYES